MERGFTYVHTSYVYHNGKSESAIRKTLVERYPGEAPAFSVTEPVTKNTSHSREILPRRFAYDFMIVDEEGKSCT